MGKAQLTDAEQSKLKNVLDQKVWNHNSDLDFLDDDEWSGIKQKLVDSNLLQELHIHSEV